MTEQLKTKLEWGCRRHVPDNVEIVWGARAIWTGTEFDLVFNRQSCVAEDDSLRVAFGSALERALTDARIQFKHMCEHGYVDEEFNERPFTIGSCGKFVLTESHGVVIVCDPQESYGYVYLAAWPEPEPQPSGYTPCACRDCMEISIDGGMCHECEEHDCEPDTECNAPHAYGGSCFDPHCCALEAHQ